MHPGCYYYILPNDNSTPPKHTNQILYLLSYSGVFPIIQRLSLKVEMPVCMWTSIRSGVHSKYWDIYNVMRVLHCISVRKGEMQNYFTLDWTTISGRIQFLPLCLITTFDYYHKFLFNFYLVPTTRVTKRRKPILTIAKNNFWHSHCLSSYTVLQMVFIPHP